MAHHKIALKFLLTSAALMAMNGAAGCSGLAGMHAVSAQEVAAESWSYGLPEIAGTITDGGRGGAIVHVTTLDSEGPGSLRAALEMEGPRIIVFDVAGAIDLAGNNLRVRNSDVTIAGQTAPSPGITILRGGMVIGANDVIVQHIRIRPGDFGEAPRSGRDVDAITTSAAHNVIVDHCTLSWATDENLSASGPRFTGDSPEDWRDGTSKNILFSNNIIAEGLSHSTHAKGEHSKGSLIHDNVSDIIIYANLYSSNYERSPLFKGGVHGALVNNFIYNPGQRAIHYNLQGLEWGDVPAQAGHMDLVGNVMRAGPSTSDGLPLLMIGGDGSLDLHARDNLAIDKWGSPLPALGQYTTAASATVDTTGPSDIITGLPILDASEVEPYVLKNAGARPWDRDAVDVRILADTAEGRGEIIDSQDQVGGYPAVEPTHRVFDPSQWDLETMQPVSEEALDSGLKAKGT